MIKNEYLVEFEKSPPIADDVIKSLKLAIDLPNDYLNILRLFNGGEGNVGEEYVVLHKGEELLEINKDCEIAGFDAKNFISGSNGNGEYIAPDFRKQEPASILIPFIYEYDAIIELSLTIEGLFHRIYNQGYFSNG